MAVEAGIVVDLIGAGHEEQALAATGKETTRDLWAML
jgi:hypothetical protein